jgi:heat shock protein HslJ
MRSCETSVQPGSRLRLPVSGLIALFFAVACSAQSQRELLQGAPPPSLDEIRNSPVNGLFDEPVTLRDGHWEGEAYAESGASRPSAGIAGDLVVYGDLDNDGEDEAVTFLWSSTGGSGTRNFVGVFERDAAGISNTATALIGDRVQVRSARIVGQRLETDVVQHGPSDAMCCPTVRALRLWSLEGGELREGPAVVLGPIGVSDLDGTMWRLVRSGDRELAQDIGDVTLRIDGQRIAGRAPCNRYAGAIADRNSPGELEIGALASTEKACASGLVMRMEQDFFATLMAIEHFAFLSGQLVLTGHRGNSIIALHFVSEREIGNGT